MNGKKYFAHTNEAEKQLLKDHLVGTATLAESFSLPAYGACAYFLGLLHDIGKYQPSFQRRLMGSDVRVEHSVCGAKEVEKIIPVPETSEYIWRLFQYVIAGHHSGLPDCGEKADGETYPTLLGRLCRASEDYSAYASEIKEELAVSSDRLSAELPQIFADYGSLNALRDKYEFLIRYLYSCLTDADYLDTESFCVGKRAALPRADFKEALLLLNRYLCSFVADTPLKAARSRLQAQAYKNVQNGGKIYLLNMPTGSGKTLCSLHLALDRAIKTGKNRIIYVIPYTSIIEQTSKEFRSFFPAGEILEHHSNFDSAEMDDELGSDVNGILKKSSENWDASIIITTNVQFFESVYSNRSSRLRKLHNMANSIIVFDEIHTLPVDYLIPCLKAVGALTEDYGSEAIFLTATMPSYARLAERFNKVFGNICPVDLLPDKSDYGLFDKCIYEYLGLCDPLEKIDFEKSTLVICNTKSTARRFYDNCPEIVGRKYFLSTYITPNDRSRLISEIKTAMKDGEKPIVFSTSLVEAGVDFDFDCVFRELAGLDNILQAGGRCNREGKRAKKDSRVYIFKSENTPSADVKIRANITEGIIGDDRYPEFSLKDMENYFDEVFRFSVKPPRDDVTPYNFYKIPFATIAENFRFIDNASVAVIVPDKDIESEMAQLKAVGFCNRRKLSRYCATVNRKELEALLKYGIIEELSGVFILRTPENYYSPETGIKTDGGDDFMLY